MSPNYRPPPLPWGLLLTLSSSRPSSAAHFRIASIQVSSPGRCVASCETAMCRACASTGKRRSVRPERPYIKRARTPGSIPSAQTPVMTGSTSPKDRETDLAFFRKLVQHQAAEQRAVIAALSRARTGRTVGFDRLVIHQWLRASVSLGSAKGSHCRLRRLKPTTSGTSPTRMISCKHDRRIQ